MKFEQKKEGFKPVTITLETMSEVRLFAALLGGTSGRHVAHAAQCSLSDNPQYTAVWEHLNEICCKDYGHLEISVME